MRPLLLFAGIAWLTACQPGQALRTDDSVFWQKKIESSHAFARSHTGFVLTDPGSGRTLAAVNADKCFTPASNAKILTLAVCLEALRDSLPRFRYQMGDPPMESWVAAGTGDPTTLHPDFAAWQQIPPMLQDTATTPVFFFSLPGTAQLPRMPAGWMWDDMPYAFSTEITELPLFGNAITVGWTGREWRTQPSIFQQWIKPPPGIGTEIKRAALGEDIFVPETPPGEGHTATVPMFNPRQYIPRLLADTLRGMLLFEPDIYLHYNLAPERRWYACPTDTAYRRMMHQSDNFFAEQLLLLCAGEKFDSLDIALIQRWAVDSLWGQAAAPIRWADGSGLSRYNLLSPRFLASVLQQLWQRHPRERLFDLFPAAGLEGTLQDEFATHNGVPFVFAKSGSMSGVYCLSGYLQARSGRVLAFSCMNNGIAGSIRPWKKAVAGLLEEAYQRY